MKTKSNTKTKLSSELNNRSHHQSDQAQPVAAAQPERKDNRDGKGNLPPIDTKARMQNRTLPTPKVLNLLLTSLPDVYRAAEVVGRWVWVHFENTPAAEIRQQLAQLGFHWNRQRQAWQHPCGQFSMSSPSDPHEKYASYFPADQRAA